MILNFLPIENNLSPNITVGEGYEYKDTMILYIKDFAPQLPVKLDLPVYTMNPETYHGMEQITTTIIAVQKEE